MVIIIDNKDFIYHLVNLMNVIIVLQTLNQRPGQMQPGMHNKMPSMNMLQNQQMNMNQMQNIQNNPMMSQMNQMIQGNMGQQMVPQPVQGLANGPQMGPNQMQQSMQVIVIIYFNENYVINFF